MAPSYMREKLHRYIEVANEKKLLTIYTILEEEIEDDYFGTAIKVDQEIVRYLSYLNVQQLKAVLGLVKVFAASNKDWRSEVSGKHQRHK